MLRTAPASAEVGRATAARRLATLNVGRVMVAAAIARGLRSPLIAKPRSAPSRGSPFGDADRRANQGIAL